MKKPEFEKNPQEPSAKSIRKAMMLNSAAELFKDKVISCKMFDILKDKILKGQEVVKIKTIQSKSGEELYFELGGK